jgi:FAD-dependent urate hydroxylase
VRNGVRLDDGTVSECVRRSDLQRVLREEALARGVTIRYGKRLERLEHGVGSVTARFADGTQEAGDILIGADGIHSRTRQLIQPDAPPPVYTGQISVGGYSRLPDLEPTSGSQQFVFGRRGFFGYLVRDGGEVWWFANAAHPVSSTAELAAVPPERWRQRMLDLFSDDLPVIRRIVAASSDRIGAHPVFDIPTSRRWSRGPVVLVGDAVHATSPSAGQGASLAIEDAVVLAKCLRDIPEPARAFARYERLRRERVEKVVAYARKRGSNKTAGPVARVLRDAMMPLVLKLSASDSAHAWMYRYHIDWDAPVVTRDPAR